MEQRFRSEKNDVYTEEINKIALGSNDDKRMQWIDLIETHTHRASIDLHCGPKKAVPQNQFTMTFEARKIMSQAFVCLFSK